VTTEVRRPSFRPPRLLIAASAVLTVVAGGLRVYFAVRSQNATTPSVLTAEGFLGSNTEPPATGSWLASGLVVSAAGYRATKPGEREDRVWEINHICVHPGGCVYTISREIAGERGPERPLTAVLTPERDGWHAIFPAREYVCGGTVAGPIFWPEHFSLVLRFAHGGKSAEANGRDFSYEASCGYGTTLVRWRARHADEHVRIEGSRWAPLSHRPPS
jgi:hypothetical protein